MIRIANGRPQGITPTIPISDFNLKYNRRSLVVARWEMAYGNTHIRQRRLHQR